MWLLPSRLAAGETHPLPVVLEVILGPSYSLSTRRAAVQRSIGWMLRAVEPGNEKAGFFLQQCPGLTRLANAGAEIRGGWWTGSRGFVVAGTTLYEVSSTWTLTARGTLLTSTGRVDITQGLTQLVIVDGANGYVLTLATNTFARITDPDFYGSTRVGFLDGFFIFTRPDTQQFYISAIDNAASLDALDFASAESAPDKLKAVLVDHREVWLFGEVTTEVWFNAGTSFPFQRNNGAVLEVGCVAAQTAQKMDNSVFWLGQDRNGAGMVWRAEGYQPRRISTFAVEEVLKTSTDLSAATAYCYQDEGQSFYVLKAPGLETTWVYEVSSGQWHERAEIVNGQIEPWRAVAHCYMHGTHVVGDADGKLYELDPSAYTNDGDVLYRERTSPHSATPERDRVFFDLHRLDVEVGETGSGISPVIELRYSDDGGYTWGNWLARSLGEIGQFRQRVEWRRLGSARDRVWQIRTTDNARASIINSAVMAAKGTA